MKHNCNKLEQESYQMKQLLELIRKPQTAWYFYVPSEEDLNFIKELEESLNK